MDKVCEDFPLSWCRNVDLIPIMSMQSKLNKDKEVFYFKGTASTSKSKETPNLTTELGINISPSSIDTNKLNVVYGTKIPNINGFLSLNEIWEDTKKELPEMPDIVINQKGMVHKIPRNIIDESVIDGAEHLYQMQSSTRNPYSVLRKKINLPIVNTYHIAKAGLLEHEKIRPRDPCFKRLRSVLKTDWIKPSNEKGWYELQRILFKLERGLRGKIEGRKRGINWWEDTAQPMYFGGHINHTELNVRVCMLDDRHKLIGI